METSVRQQGNWTVVKISGRIQLEKTREFRAACLKSLKNRDVIFELDRLQFVGSTGMTEFFESLRAVKESSTAVVKIVGLCSDFKRFVGFTLASTLTIHETLEEAFRPSLGSELRFSPDPEDHSASNQNETQGLGLQSVVPQASDSEKN
jgi:anti-anti-sigma factor